MRIGVAYLIQESNTFSPLLTSLDDFGITAGPALVERWRGTRTEIGGFCSHCQGLRQQEIESVLQRQVEIPPPVAKPPKKPRRKL